jgi:hypothetical protein
MMLPIEGIDKIKVLLNPIHINFWRLNQLPFRYGIWYPDPQNRITLHQSGMFIALCVHAEYFDIHQDCQYQIATAIYGLVKLNIIAIPDQEYTDTWYAGPVYNKAKGKKSPFSIYNKDAKDRHDNHIDHEELDAYPYKTRMEFRLDIGGNAGQWLGWMNFRGNYFDIFQRYLGYLSVFYRNFLYGNIETSGKENTMSNKIKHAAKKLPDSRSTKNRYRGTALAHTDIIPEEYLYPNRLSQSEKEEKRIHTLAEMSKFIGENGNGT